MILLWKIFCDQIRHLEKKKAVKFLVGQDIAKVNCMKWSGGDIKDLISPKVHLKTSIMEVTLPFIAWKHQHKIKNVITVGIVAFILSAGYFLTTLHNELALNNEHRHHLIKELTHPRNINILVYIHVLEMHLFYTCWKYISNICMFVHLIVRKHLKYILVGDTHKIFSMNSEKYISWTCGWLVGPLSFIPTSHFSLGWPQ